MVQNIQTLTEEDFENARKLYEEEKISPINRENMFSALIYCILSSAEKYPKQKSIYAELRKYKVDTPGRIEENKEELRKVIGKARFPNRKIQYILELASWWPKTDLPERIIEDINNGRKNEFSLRNQLAEEAPGIGYKNASLFMIKCGYENVVPIDVWVLRFLKDMGYEVRVPNYRTIGSPTPKEYIEYEKLFSGIAKRYGASPSFLQLALWSKYSSWNKRK